MLIIAALTIVILTSLPILHSTLQFVRQNCKITKNYRGKEVYNSAGIFFTFMILLICMLYIIISVILPQYAYIQPLIIIIVVGVLSASFTGCLDDNSRDISKGIAGHFKLLIRGKITSGSIKAVVGVFISFIISLNFGDKNIYLLIDTLLICMVQNLVNLLDLRPGRAIKTYMTLSLISLPFANFFSAYTGLNVGIISITIFYLPYELKEEFIMGDIGSNVLGIILGIIIASSKFILFKVIVFAFVIIVQIYAEKKSINDFIEYNRSFKFVDMLGREKQYEYDKD